MVVRLLAVLVALGLVAGVAQASVVVTDATALTQAAAGADEADERTELEVVIAHVAVTLFARATTAVMPPTQLPGFQHCALVFRPPRASAFV